MGVPVLRPTEWTDSTIVLSWLQGNPRRFKVYVGNQIAQIMDLTSLDCWNHVSSSENPADCASHCMFPSEILEHPLWWNGPKWLKLPQTDWPKRFTMLPDTLPEEMFAIPLTTVIASDPLIPFDRFSRFNHYKRVTAWVIRFLDNCRARKRNVRWENGPLTIQELDRAGIYWF